MLKRIIMVNTKIDFLLQRKPVTAQTTKSNTYTRTKPWIPVPQWEIQMNYKHQRKEGTRHQLVITHLSRIDIMYH
jgi:hypothetical protein